MSRIVTPLLAATLMAAAFPRVAAADETADRVAKVENCISATWYGAPPKYLDRATGHGPLKTIGDCAAAARAVVDQDGPAREIKLPGKKPSVPVVREDGGRIYARADEVAKHVDAYHDQLRVGLVRGDLEEAQKTIDWYDTLTEVGEDEGMRLSHRASNCAKAVDAGVAAGLPASVKIDISPKVSMVFGDVKKNLCDYLGAMATEVKKSLEAQIKKELEAKLAPFRKVLTGDKITVFVDQGMVELEVYTKGGALMSTPEHFKDASLWFQVLGYTDDLGYDHWTLRRFQFKGTKLIKQTEDTGLGRNPPSSKYK